MNIESADLYDDGWAPSLSRAGHAARVRFAKLVVDDEFDLGEAALLLAAEESDEDVVGIGLTRLDAMADDIRPRVRRHNSALERLETLIEYLYVESGFQGNQSDYYDPRNSYLDEVLERRVGIPISLGAMVKEVGRRVEIPLEGVTFPAHFLLRHARLPGVYVDPFNHGRLLSLPDCKVLLERVTRGRVPFRRDLLKPANNRQILVRMLANLRAIYADRGDVVRTLAALDRILLLVPGSANALRERGVLLIEAGAIRGGLDDLEIYLALARQGADWIDVKRQIDQAKRKVRSLN